MHHCTLRVAAHLSLCPSVRRTCRVIAISSFRKVDRLTYLIAQVRFRFVFPCDFLLFSIVEYHFHKLFSVSVFYLMFYAPPVNSKYNKNYRSFLFHRVMLKLLLSLVFADIYLQLFVALNPYIKIGINLNKCWLALIDGLLLHLLCLLFNYLL